jgi:hypothetical protein
MPSIDSLRIYREFRHYWPFVSKARPVNRLILRHDVHFLITREASTCGRETTKNGVPKRQENCPENRREFWQLPAELAAKLPACLISPKIRSNPAVSSFPLVPMLKQSAGNTSENPPILLNR